MTDSELVAVLSPYFNVTRPELAPKPKGPVAISPEDRAFDQQLKQKMAKLAELGIDLSGVMSGVKRKR